MAILSVFFSILAHSASLTPLLGHFMNDKMAILSVFFSILAHSASLTPLLGHFMNDKMAVLSVFFLSWTTVHWREKVFFRWVGVT